MTLDHDGLTAAGPALSHGVGISNSDNLSGVGIVATLLPHH